jgi:oligoribonuclease NrnB/cAMP/cGMP phosphodiesterase (DHH superfamily)
MKTYIIHHNDLDGYAAAGIAKAYLIREGHTPTLIEMHYSKTLPDIFEADDIVYMLDFSLQPFEEKMVKFAETVSDFVWIDHHASVMKEYDEYLQERKDNWSIKGIRNSDFCGAELTWAWFNLEPGQPMSDVKDMCEMVPLSVRLVGDWDTWRHVKIEDSSAPFFKMAFDTFTPEDTIEWFRMRTDYFISGGEVPTPIERDLVAIGRRVKAFETNESTHLMKSRAFEAKLIVPSLEYIVYSVIAANMGVRGSDRFSSVYNPIKHAIMLGFAYENTGKVTVSLYSTNPNIDCGAIAKSCGEAGPFPGGGGHKGAAGFQTSWEFLMEKLLVLEKM